MICCSQDRLRTREVHRRNEDRVRRNADHLQDRARLDSEPCLGASRVSNFEWADPMIETILPDNVALCSQLRELGRVCSRMLEN